MIDWFRLIGARPVWLIALLLAGCATPVTVKTDYDPSTNFTAYRTYAWRPVEPPAVDDPLFDSKLFDIRVRAAIERSLSSKGYQKAVPGTDPDFLVGYHAVVQRKVSSQTINRRYRYRVGARATSPETYAREYDEGTLLIDVVDPAANDLLWRGTGTGVVDPRANAEKREQRINDAVKAILAKFPSR